MYSKDKTGIYVIEQAGTDRFYIGSSVRIYARWYGHRRALDAGRHHSPFLQNAWTKHGADAFVFSVLEECAREELLEREQEYIDAFKPTFNVCPLARSRYGSKVSEETRAKIAAAVRARPRERKTQCSRGHPFDAENTHLDSGGWQQCRACGREKTTRWSRARGVQPKRTGEATCKNGHAYTERDFNKRGNRECQACKLDSTRRIRRASGARPKAYGPDKMACTNGHPFNEQNTGVDPNGHRFCRECGRIRAREYQRRKRGGEVTTC